LWRRIGARRLPVAVAEEGKLERARSITIINHRITKLSPITHLPLLSTEPINSNSIS
jgi:hypothetical protein